MVAVAFAGSVAWTGKSEAGSSLVQVGNGSDLRLFWGRKK